MHLFELLEKRASEVSKQKQVKNILYSLSMYQWIRRFIKDQLSENVKDEVDLGNEHHN
jgi:hypothetical protein